MATGIGLEALAQSLMPSVCTRLAALALDGPESDAARFGPNQVRGNITLKTAVLLLDVCRSGAATDPEVCKKCMSSADQHEPFLLQRDRCSIAHCFDGIMHLKTSRKGVCALSYIWALVQSIKRVLFSGVGAATESTAQAAPNGLPMPHVSSLTDHAMGQPGLDGDQTGSWRYTVEGMFQGCSWGACNFSVAGGSTIIPHVSQICVRGML